MTRSTVFCTVHLEGIHRWETCPIEEVKYLRDDHRHIFIVKAYVPVTHSDRDVEFIWLKHQIQNYMRTMYWSQEYNCHYFDKRSCEMIAEELIREFGLSMCEVSEDGENGAIVEVD